MAAVDYAAAWDSLQAALLQRDGWGTRSVLALMADLRVQHRIPEPDVARALRLAGAVTSGEVAVHPPLAVSTARPVEGPQEDRHEHHESRSV